MTTLLAERPVADRRGGVWDYISASRLNLWLKCPLAFKIKYIDGVPESTKPSLFLGRMVHRGLEYFYRRRQLGLGIADQQVSRTMLSSWDEAVIDEGMAFTNADEEQRTRDQAVRLVEAYLNRMPLGESRPLAVETSLSSPLVDPASGEDLGIPLVGVVDLVLDDPTGPTICDFKTAASSKPPLEISHEIQLGCYAHLFRRCAGRKEGGLEIRSLVKTKTPQIATHRYEPRSKAHLKRLFAVIRSYLDDLDRGQFLYRPTWTCGMCNYRDKRCAAWEGGSVERRAK